MIEITPGGRRRRRFLMRTLGEFENWNGLFAPAKTPGGIIDRLRRETAAAVRHPEVQKCLSDLGAEAVGSSPAEQEAILRRQMDPFRPVIREMKLD